MPRVRLAALSAPGPSADKQEHLDDIMHGAGPAQKRRLVKAMDELTFRWATNTLPEACRWLLNTQILFLRKDREPTRKIFDDSEWLSFLDGSALSDIPWESVDAVRREVEADAPLAVLQGSLN